VIATILRLLGPTESLPHVPDDVTVVRNAWIPLLGGRLAGMPGPASAVTLGRTIVLHPDATASPGLLRHELEHVRPWADAPLSFPFRYAWLHLKHGYRDNPYEVEARDAEAARSPG
jgi:hypothetical protein